MPESETEDGYVFYDGELLGVKRPIFTLFDQTGVTVLRFSDHMLLHITDDGNFEEVIGVAGITQAFIDATGLTGRTQGSPVYITSINRDEFIYKALPM